MIRLQTVRSRTRVLDSSSCSLTPRPEVESLRSPRHGQRRMLAHWTYGRMIRYLQEECGKVGVSTEAPDERWSSRTCHRCGSRHTERLTQSIFHCWVCELIYNADFNSGINIGSRFLLKATTRQATDDLAYARNEQVREIVACEPRSPHPFMGGS
jgi:transposase